MCSINNHKIAFPLGIQSTRVRLPDPVLAELGHVPCFMFFKCLSFLTTYVFRFNHFIVKWSEDVSQPWVATVVQVHEK